MSQKTYFKISLVLPNMSQKTYFKNEYVQNDFSPSQYQILDSSGISAEFYNKLKTFTTTKLKYLTNILYKDIFHDSTVYTGSAGLAYYYWNCAENNNCNIEFLREALKYIDINKLNSKRITFLCGDAGPLAIATVVLYKLGPKVPPCFPDYKTLVQRLMSLIKLLNDSPDEILYGKSGYLYALMFVNKHLQSNVIPDSHIQKVVDAIIESGKQFSANKKSSSPLLWKWHEKIYFGAAHGMAGILFMLLQAKYYIKTEAMQNLVKPSIDWLMEQRLPSKNFPSSLGSMSGDRLVQWCHGAPGFVPLCISAYHVFTDERYLNIALDCGEVIWQRGLCTKGYSLCHGVSGNAYAFIQLYQATKDSVHLYRACRFAEWSMSEAAGTELLSPDRPASLFEGLVGRLCLAHDLTHLHSANFPAFTLQPFNAQ